MLFPFRVINRSLPLLVVASLAIYPAVASAFDKCRHPDGTVTYQNEPCEGSKQAVTKAPPPPPPSTNISAAAERGDLYLLTNIHEGMGPLTSALTRYYVEHAMFPGKEAMLRRQEGRKPALPGSVWDQLGFSEAPMLPYGVESFRYVPLDVNEHGGADSYVLIYVMKSASRGPLDGLLLGVSPSPHLDISKQSIASSHVLRVKGQSVMQLYYSCHQWRGESVAPLVNRVFSNPDGDRIECN